MGLDDISRREFLTYVGSTFVALQTPELFAQDAKQNGQEFPIMKKNRITFEKAKANAQLQTKYLEQLLIDEYQLASDKKRNPSGVLGRGWFYWPDKKHQENAMELLKEDAKNEGRKIEDLTRQVNSLLGEFTLVPRCKGPPGRQQSDGYVLIDESFFKLTNEAEAFSEMDRLLGYVVASETGKVADLPMDQNNRYIAERDTFFIGLNAAWSQLTKVLGGARKVSDEYREKALARYARRYSTCKKFIKTFTDGIPEEARTKDMKDAVAFIESYTNKINEDMQKHGYEHKLVDEKKGKYDLVKINK